MSPPEPVDERLLRLAEAIADQQEVDWEEFEESWQSDDLAESITKLRALEGLSCAFRAAAADLQPESAAGPLFRWGTLDVRVKLGEGGFGEVYRAYDPALDREVALKLRRPGPSSVAGGGRRFVREAQKLARVHHPNVVTVHGADLHDGKVGFWTDLIDGKTLREVVHDQGPMGADEAASIGLSVCRALAAVHAAGIVHGDVKPSNVMREQGGRIVLMDFGAASMAAGKGELAGAIDFQGTPGTLAPELLEGELPTAASDLYSLGATLYFLATGIYPVRADSFEELSQRHREGDAVPLRDRRADLPAAFVEVVDRTLAVEPADRYPSAGAMERALVRAMGGDLDTKRPAGNRPRWWMAAGVLVAALLGYWLWTSRHGTTPSSVVPRASLTLREVEVFASGDGDQGEASFSPDGRMIAYVDNAEGVAQVWIRSVAGGERLQITDGEDSASRPRWSNRDEIVFSRGGGIWAVPALGGEPRQVVAEGVNPDVSPDGSTLVYEHARWLWTVSADGGTPRRMESVPRRFFAEAWATPALSPDGTEVVYFMQETGPLGDLWITALDGGQPRRLTFDRVEAGGPAWTPNGEGLVFWSRRHGTLNLWHLAIDSGEIRPLTTGVGEDSAPAVSPDGSRLAFNNTENRWILTGRDTATGTERELIDRRLPIWIPELSPDGRRLAFFQAVGPAYHLFTVDLDGSGLRQVTTRDEEWNIHPRWSWDGEHLYYYQERPQPEFRRVPASGGESELIARGWTWQTHMHAAPSPDDLQIAYVEQDADGGSTLIWNRQSDHRQTLPEPHIHAPQWSPDGTELVGFTHDGQVRRCTLDPLICERVTDGFRARLSTGGETIYFHRHLRGTRWELWAVDADGGNERRLSVTGPHGRLDRTFAVTPEGEVIYTRYQPGESDLWTASFVDESLD